jgi:hypothetical protein
MMIPPLVRQMIPCRRQIPCRRLQEKLLQKEQEKNNVSANKWTEGGE